MLIKVYRAASEGEGRYSPAEVASTEVVPVMGQPDPDRIRTSIIERSNLSLRMGLRRFTRLTNGFQRSGRTCAAVLLGNLLLLRTRHRSLRTTPAMAAGITDHIWRVRELLEAARSERSRYGPDPHQPINQLLVHYPLDGARNISRIDYKVGI